MFVMFGFFSRMIFETILFGTRLITMFQRSF
jgi:hypothetical protein